MSTYWETIGSVDKDVLDLTQDSLAQGLPAWPDGHQRYKVVRTWQSLILASEGLSGAGMELYIELPGAQGLLGEQMATQWQKDILRPACLFVATGRITTTAAQMVMLPASPLIPDHLVTTVDGVEIVPAIVGMPVPGRAMQQGNVAYLPVTPITARELTHALEGDVQKIIDARATAGFYHVLVDSPSVLSLIDDNVGD